MNGVRIIVMCKAPVPGRVKSRLIGPYSEQQAAGIHQAMAVMVIARAMRLFADVRIAADDPTHPFFKQFSAPLVGQGEGSLGERMERLMQDAFAQGLSAVMFLGTDSPHMPDERLLQAAEALSSSDVVIGPVEDGGYDLIAMRGCWPELFNDIDWGGPKVLAQSLQRIARLGLLHRCLDTSFDVDTPADVQRLERDGFRLCPETGGFRTTSS